jgi:hypothetical protein
MADDNPNAHISLGDFHWGAVPTTPRVVQAAQADPPLGPLASFAPAGEDLPDDATQVFRGNGFNTIFRPQNVSDPASVVQLPKLPAQGPDDNVLELNLTREKLTFSKALGSVPNRGAKNLNGDAFLNGVPYIQRIDDITLGREKPQAVGIHFEPGVWLAVPSTDKPAEVASFVRMASIPHGTTINAQGIAFKSLPSAPPIHDVDITPFVIATGNRLPGVFPSQTAANLDTFRIPQDLAAGLPVPIDPGLLANPNKLLQDRLATQTIINTDTLFVTTNPPPRVPPFDAPPATVPSIGGGTDNIAFLQGDAAGPNADAVAMSSIFWIETVQVDIVIPACKQGDPISVDVGEGDLKVTFVGTAPCDLDTDCPLKVTYTQIQYSQLVILNFSGLGWPHVSVANLVPDAPIPLDSAAIEAASLAPAPAAAPAGGGDGSSGT